MQGPQYTRISGVERMSITHQDIADRADALCREHSKAYQAEQDRIAAERKSLQELCGGIGHIWKRSEFSFVTAGQCCAICGAWKA